MSDEITFGRSGRRAREADGSAQLVFNFGGPEIGVFYVCRDLVSSYFPKHTLVNVKTPKCIHSEWISPTKLNGFLAWLKREGYTEVDPPPNPWR